jgi:hypothetical protein
LDRSRLIVSTTSVVGLGLIGLWAFLATPEDEFSEPIVYVQNADEFSDYVELPHLGILTSENYLGHQIREIEGSVLNLSTRTLRSIGLRLAFESVSGAVVLESDEEALRAPLEPGQERLFVFRFENLPEDWNYRVPAVEIRSVGY